MTWSNFNFLWDCFTTLLSQAWWLIHLSLLNNCVEVLDTLLVKFSCWKPSGESYSDGELDPQKSTRWSALNVSSVWRLEIQNLCCFLIPDICSAYKDVRCGIQYIKVIASGELLSRAIGRTGSHCKLCPSLGYWHYIQIPLREPVQDASSHSESP